MQARRRGRHCLTTSSMTTWWKCSHSSIRCDFSWSTSRIWLRYTRSCSFPQIWQSTGLRSGLLAGHRAGVMKSRVSWVNRCIVSRALWTGALSCWKVKKSPVCNAILETDIFCRQYLDINNTHNTTQPFYGSVEFVRENPGEPVPEETFTHYSHRSHQSSLSAFSI